MKTIWMFVLAVWEMPRQMFISLMTPSEDYEKMNDYKERANYMEMLPNGMNPEQFELSIEDELKE